MSIPSETYSSFIIRNISRDRRTIKVFNNKIQFYNTLDLIHIPGISENEIKNSLLKGELKHKLLIKEILIEYSDLNLVTYNTNQKEYLTNSGIENGISPTLSNNDIATVSETAALVATENIVAANTNVNNALFVTPATHSKLKDIIHFLHEGPSQNSYKEVTGVPFPISIIWYVDNSKLQKITEKIIQYNVRNLPIAITYNVYKEDGLTLLHSITDYITYNSINIFEFSRTRIINV